MLIRRDFLTLAGLLPFGSITLLDPDKTWVENVWESIYSEFNKKCLIKNIDPSKIERVDVVIDRHFSEKFPEQIGLYCWFDYGFEFYKYEGFVNKLEKHWAFVVIMNRPNDITDDQVTSMLHKYKTDSKFCVNF